MIIIIYIINNNHSYNILNNNDKCRRLNTLRGGRGGSGTEILKPESDMTSKASSVL